MFIWLIYLDNRSPSINRLQFTVNTYHLFDKKLIASYESFYQPSLEQGDNYRWQVELGLEIPLKKFLNFKIDYRSTYESIVIEDQEEGDRFLTFGFTLKNF